MKIFRKYCCVFTALILSGAAAHAENLIQDGSFEAPIVPAGTYTSFSPGPIGSTGWTVVGPSTSNVLVISGTYAFNGKIYGARAGAQWLDLTGTMNMASGVSQTVPTIAGRMYKLTFHVGNVIDVGVGASMTTSTVHVYVNNLMTLTAVNRFAGSSTGLTHDQAWRAFSTTIVATGPTTQIKFINGDPATDGSCGLDDVSLEPLYGVGE